jgi:hypothetical protein
MILYDHIRGTGGTTICHHLREKFPDHFQINPANPSRSIREFATMPPEQRHAFKLVCGQNAAALASWANPKLVAMTVLRDPVDRVLSLYKTCKASRAERWHLLCKAYSVVWCAKNVGSFSNHYQKTFRPGKFRYLFTSPTALLSTCGITGEILRLGENAPLELSQDDLDQVALANRDDIQIWERVLEASRLGVVRVG